MKKGLQFGDSYDIINLFTFVLVFLAEKQAVRMRISCG